ncbi:MAG: ankyrin repeat-containing protein [Caulobacter sp.]|nr:ankyrin repeat-containing protein [Caulobacter sp.]
MGSFSTNLHVRGVAPGGLASALSALEATPAYVTAVASHGWTSVYPSNVDQDEHALHRLGARLSHDLGAPVITFLLHDSDIFSYELFEKGHLVDRYESNPGYFEGRNDPPTLHHPEVLLPYGVEGASLDGLLRLLRQVGADGEPLSRTDVAIEQLRSNYAHMAAGNPQLPPLADLIDRMRQMQGEKAQARARFASEMARELSAGPQSEEQHISAIAVMGALALWLGLTADRAETSYRYIAQGETHAGEMLLVEAN